MKVLEQLIKELPEVDNTKVLKDSITVRKMKLDFIRQIDNNIRVLREHGVNQITTEEFDYLMSITVPQLERVLNEVYIQTLALRDLQKHLLKVNG